MAQVLLERKVAKMVTVALMTKMLITSLSLFFFPPFFFKAAINSGDQYLGARWHIFAFIPLGWQRNEFLLRRQLNYCS